MKETLSKLYRLQVLADQLRTTHRRKIELKKLRELNDHDYHSLHRLLNQQQSGLEEALALKKTIYREMFNGCSQIARIKRAQNAQNKKIDFRSEVQLDKRLTSSQNMLKIDTGSEELDYKITALSTGMLPAKLCSKFWQRTEPAASPPPDQDNYKRTPSCSCPRSRSWLSSCCC